MINLSTEDTSTVPTRKLEEMEIENLFKDFNKNR